MRGANVSNKRFNKICVLWADMTMRTGQATHLRPSFHPREENGITNRCSSWLFLMIFLPHSNTATIVDRFKINGLVRVDGDIADDVEGRQHRLLRVRLACKRAVQSGRAGSSNAGRKVEDE